MLLSVAQLEKVNRRYESFKTVDLRQEISSIDKEDLKVVIDESLPPEIVEGNIIGDQENLRKRKQMLATLLREPAEFAFERAIGKNDSVYSNFVELMAHVKQKVGRIVVKSGSENLGYATGFMVSPNLLMTNWHVFETKESVLDSVVQFNYELDLSGNPKAPIITFELSVSTFFHSSEPLDYCLIGVRQTDTTGNHKLNEIGSIYLDPSLGKLGNENEELLNIIHHPNGDYKQLSIRKNTFTKILPTTLWYESDTAQGSSGGPVFNDQWQVVALHHMGVASKNDAGDYLDKNGDIIPIDEHNRIDVSRIHWVANEGIRISVIMKDLKATFPASPFIKELQTPPQEVSTPLSAHPNAEFHKGSIEKITSEKNCENSVDISFPSALLESQGTIDIQVSVGTKTQLEQKKTPTPDTRAALDDQEFESKKLEAEIDYSACKGYQSKFLGPAFNIPIPEPQEKIKKFIAKVNGSDGHVLKYHKFSVVFHAARMMPILSAINVDGDLSKRKDKTERRDKWIRDRRIDFDIQLNEDFYKKSGFDRGHMSRREDANWGATPEEAKLHADLTCVYTNCCPQVPALNRSNKKGLWGKLEKIVLEKGATEEGQKVNKISVFSGPIFKENDPIFRGTQIPTEFYKVIVWLTSDGGIKATAFKLSQIELLDDIDLEDIDIDENLEFKEHQCSLKFLQKVTHIDFSGLFNIDTFEGKVNELIEVDSEEMLSKHLEKHIA